MAAATPLTRSLLAAAGAGGVAGDAEVPLRRCWTRWAAGVASATALATTAALAAVVWLRGATSANKPLDQGLSVSLSASFEALVHEPVENCFLQTPPPLVLFAFMCVTKTMILTKIFGPPGHDPDRASTLTEKLAFYPYTAYQFLSTPLSFLAVCYAFVKRQGPFNSAWQAYECFENVWTWGPWFFASQMLYWKVFQATMQRNLLQGGATSGMTMFRVAPGSPGTAGELVYRKATALFYLIMLTAVPFGLILAPAIVTHILPGLVIFFPEVVLVCGLVQVSQTLFDKWLSFYAPEEEDGRKSFMLQYMTCGAMLPSFLWTVLVQILVTQMTYFYATGDWVESFALGWEAPGIAAYLYHLKDDAFDSFYTGLAFVMKVV